MYNSPGYTGSVNYIDRDISLAKNYIDREGIFGEAKRGFVIQRDI